MSQTTCPSCHQTIPARIQSTTANLLGSRDDQVALIHHETRRLDRLIAQLNEERAALLRRLNAIQSPTITLPTETLSSIFEYACPPPDFSERHTFPSYTEDDVMGIPEYQYLQFTVAAVSSHWCQVVRSSPRLWACIALDITEETAERKATFLQLFIENSKKVPFTIALYFSDDVDPRSSYLVHENVDNLIIEALPRIKELHLVNPPRKWHNYTPYLTQLRDCSLNLSRLERLMPDGRVIFPSNAPLRRLSLQEALWRSVRNIQLPWTTLTTLNLVFIPPDLSVQVFIQCPNLVYFRCCSPSRRQPPPEPVTLSNPISLQHLVSFHWETDDSPWSRALIQYLYVPSLREMHWNTFHDTDTDNNDTRAFFNRLPSTLTTLVFDTTTSHLEYIRDDSNIENIVLRNCTTRDFRTLFHKLTPRWWEGGRAIIPVPRLERVVIGGGVYNETTMAHIGSLAPNYSAALVETLEQRLSGSNGSFTFEMEMITLEWRPETEAKLTELINKGYNIGIMEGFDDDF